MLVSEKIFFVPKIAYPQRLSWMRQVFFLFLFDTWLCFISSPAIASTLVELRAVKTSGKFLVLSQIMPSPSIPNYRIENFVI
jgi:hypothetical protein